ncbi:MAG: TonB-dependent receptor plug domain-containing protein, partial [Candidatus Kapaibacterium sp.]
MNKYKCCTVSALLIICVSIMTAAEKDSLKSYEIPNVSIIGDRSEQLGSIPGSAVIISSEQLRNMRSLSGNQVLRTVTGVNVVDEEGAGLRMNMGIRGLDPDRSRALLVLEDGIPVALAPYGEPEMYYTPSIDRMSSIEVLKGSGSIIHGPQTIGGVLNYITN